MKIKIDVGKREESTLELFDGFMVHSNTLLPIVYEVLNVLASYELSPNVADWVLRRALNFTNSCSVLKPCGEQFPVGRTKGP